MKKTIIGLLTILLMIGVLPVIAEDGPTGILTWHSSIVPDVRIAWKVTSFGLGDHYEIGYEEIEIGDTIGFYIDEIPETNATLVYGEGGPSFLNLDVNGWGVSFEDVSNLLGPLIQSLIGPTSWELEDETVLDIIGMIYMNEDRTEILDLYVYEDSPEVGYVTADITYNLTFWDDYYMMEVEKHVRTVITYNVETSIAKSASFEIIGEVQFNLELDIFESTIDDAGVVINNVLAWHSSLTPNTYVGWCFTSMNLLYDDYLKLGTDLYVGVGSEIGFLIVDPIPTDPKVVYGEEEPSFLNLKVHQDSVSFYDLERPVGLVLSAVINPLSLALYNGTILDMVDVHEIREMKGSEMEVTSFFVAGVYGYLGIHFEWQEWDEYLTMEVEKSMDVTYTINMNTGIAKEVYVNVPDMGAFTLHTDIWTSDIDDTGAPISNTISFHSAIDSSTILSWDVTDLVFDDPANYMEMGEQNITVGGIFKFKFTYDIPTEVMAVYGHHGPNFVELYYNNILQPWEEMEGPGTSLFGYLINALAINMYNGTTLDIYDILEFRVSMEKEVDSYTISDDGAYIILDLHMIHSEYDYYYDETHETIMDATFKINRNTGITLEFELDMPDFAYMKWVLNAEESSIDDSGVANTDFIENTETSDTVSLPGLTLLLSAFGIASAVFIKKRR